MLLAKTLRSTTFKLALMCIGIFGAVVIALFGYVYWSAASYVLDSSDKALATELSGLREAYALGGRDALSTAVAQRIRDAPGGFYLLTDPSFAPLAGNLAIWPRDFRARAGSGNFDPAPDGRGRRLVRAMFDTLPDGAHLLVGADATDLRRFANRIYAALGSAVVLIFLLAGVASVTVTRRTMGRIEAVNTTSRAIMETGLGKRIPLRGTQDEWDQLAGNLNLMLDRIEILMREVKQATDNVAHDLRTPLSRMRGRLEKACAGRRDAVQDQALISNTIADLDDVLRIFSSLTRISQIETNDRTAAFRSVDLAEIANDVVELFDAAAEEKDVRLTKVADRPIFVTGDRDLLFDAIANLVDNGIKHGRDGGEVTLRVDQNRGEISVSVADDGPGIPDDEFQHVLKRFYRLERSRCTPGNGLGLSLVAAVARLHGARLEMIDNSPGLSVRLRFQPAAASAAGSSAAAERPRQLIGAADS